MNRPHIHDDFIREVIKMLQEIIDFESPCVTCDLDDIVLKLEKFIEEHKGDVI